MSGGVAVRRVFSSLSGRNYRLWFAGQFVSISGTWMQQIAQDWLVLQLTGRALPVGITTALQFAPVAFFGVQPYFTTGAGVYSETLGTHNDKGVAFNTGGGVKISLAGPLRVRVDYRVFKLGSGALYSPAHRIYAGLNLKF